MTSVWIGRKGRRYAVTEFPFRVGMFRVDVPAKEPGWFRPLLRHAKLHGYPKAKHRESEYDNYWHVYDVPSKLLPPALRGK